MNDTIADNAPLTDRINAEPSILRGLSSTEALLTICISFGFWFLVSLIIGFLVGHMLISVVMISTVGPLGTVWLASGWFQKIKRDRPDFYSLHQMKKKLTKYGLSSRFITQCGIWDLGRSIPPQRSPGLWKTLTGQKTSANVSAHMFLNGSHRAPGTGEE